MANTGNPYTKTQTLFPLAARTTHASSAEITNNGSSGVNIDFNISAFSGTSITYTLEYYNEAESAWVTLLASAAKSGTGRFTFIVDPRIATAANVSLQSVAKKRMRVTPSGTITSVTYSVYVTMIP